MTMKPVPAMSKGMPEVGELPPLDAVTPAMTEFVTFGGMITHRQIYAVHTLVAQMEVTAESAARRHNIYRSPDSS